MVHELVESLDRPVTIVWDEHNDRHDTGIRAVQAYDPTCTHHLVIQDDAVACRDLLAGTERALKTVPPANPVSLYVGRVKPFRKMVEHAVSAADESVSWITMAGIYWGVGVVLPIAAIDDMARWYLHSNVQNYDRRMSRWFEKQGIDCWYTWPSLVDHRGDESLVRARTARRSAHRFIEGSALTVDWSGGVVDVANSKQLDRSRQLAAKRAGV